MNRRHAFGSEENAPLNIRLENGDEDTLNDIIKRLNRVFFKDDDDMKTRFLNAGLLKEENGKLVSIGKSSRKDIEAAFGIPYDEIQAKLTANQTKDKYMHPRPERYLGAAKHYLIYGQDYLDWNDMADNQLCDAKDPEDCLYISWNCNELPFTKHTLHFEIDEGEYTFATYHNMAPPLKMDDKIWSYPIIRKFIKEGRFLDASPLVKESLMRADKALARIAQIQRNARNAPQFKENMTTRRFRPTYAPMRTTRRRRGGSRKRARR
jgi:hypothetical protein